MFIHAKSGKPAWLLSHDTEAVYSLDQAAAGRPHHTVDSFAFFSTHREATPAELKEFKSGPDKPAKAPKAPKAAKPAKAARATGQHRRKAAPAAKPPAADAPASPPAAEVSAEAAGAGLAKPGGEPHGE